MSNDDDRKTIKIDHDKACKGCGEVGACESGYCLRCNAARLNKINPLDAKVLSKASEKATGLLAENWREIILARNAAAVEAGRQGKDKFSYSVGITIKMEPKGGECDISVGIAYSVKHADETETETVTTEPELPGLGA